MTVRAPVRRAALGLALVAVIVGPFVVFAPDVDRLTAGLLVDGASRWVIAAVVFVLLAADIVAPVPSSLVCLAAGALLGPPLGVLVAATGLTVGCLAGLVLGRSAGSAAVRRLLGPDDFDGLRALMRRHGHATLVVARPVPVMAEASVLVAGASLMPTPAALGVLAAANVGVAAGYGLAGSLVDGAASFVVVALASWVVPAAGCLAVGAWRRSLRALSAAE